MLRSRLLGQASWTIGDQGLSSLSNAAIFILVARLASEAEVGRFALAFTLYTFTLGVGRALAATPFAIRYSASEDRHTSSEALVASAFVGILVAVPTATVGLCVGNFFLIVVGSSLPILLVQDGVRVILIARQRAHLAFLTDALWIFLLACGYLGAIWFDLLSAGSVTVLWLATAILCTLVAAGQARFTFAAIAPIKFLRSNLDISKYMTFEWLTVLGAAQVSLVLVGLFGVVEHVGALRAAQTLIGPLNIVSIGLTSFAIPVIARRVAGGPWSGSRIAAAALSFTAVGVSTVWCGLLLLLPDSVGAEVLGAIWAGSREVLFPMALWFLGTAVTLGPTIIFRARQLARESFLLNSTLGLLLLVVPSLGYAKFGLQGAAWGFAISTLALCPVWWIYFFVRERSCVEEG
jgi:O-antigen/teichoic acid export membrane protein